ncbi:hypothetical protein D3C81_1725600 [compost metagenome]
MEAAQEVYSRILELDDGDIDAVVNLAKIHNYLKKKLPSLTRKERNETKRRLIREWGRASLSSRMKTAIKLFISKKWIAISCIILLHILIANSWSNHIEVSPLEDVMSMMHPPEAPLNPRVPIAVFIYSWILFVGYISLIFDLQRIRRFLKFY